MLNKWRHPFDPIGAAPAAVGGAQAPMGASMGPQEGNTFDSTGPTSPLEMLQAGMEAYKSRGGVDPAKALMALRESQGIGATGRQRGPTPPVQQVRNEGAQGLEQIAQLTSHGPREGQAHLTFDLGQGVKANVYFDAHGRRKTFVYHT